MSHEHEEKSLELRLAAIEDKLSRLGLGAGDISASSRATSLPSGGVSTALSPQLCSFCFTCVISIPVSVPVHTHTGIAIAAQQTAQAQPGTASGFEKLGQ